MFFLKTILLAIEQGITELLPISSTAHLILSSKILDIKMDTYLLSVLHFGTTIALLFHFKNTFSKNIFKKENQTFWIKIFVSTIPAGIAGFLFKSFIEDILREDIIIVLSLLIWGMVMIYTEKNIKGQNIKLENISWKQALAMGLSQIIALIPGTSRSGITTIVGIFTGLGKYSAIQYSFLLGIPLLLLSSIYGIFSDGLLRVFTLSNFLAIFISAIFTLLSLKVLEKYSKKNWLTFFGMYRIVLAITILLYIYL
jgi:undecaprenyl-diphosphatase